MSTASFRPFVLGRYNLLKRLGSGALGDVFLAEARNGPDAKALYAVKVLKPPPAVDEERVLALERECKTLARLKHSNLINAVALEREGDQAFLVMEYLDGCDLGRLLGHLARVKRKLPTQVAVYVVWSVVRALTYLHGLKDARGRPVVTTPRDISPLNVAINQAGVVKLADLGSASRGDPMVLSALGLMKGRMGYLAPEVMQQEPADQRADVFSTGVVLWECLTGRRLFKGKTDEEVITAVLTREVPPPQTLEPGVPEALGAAVLRALARKPADRFQTAAELEQALLASLAGTTPRVMSQALAKLVSQFVPIATPQQLAELPRPEEPDGLDEPIDIQDAASAPSGGEEPANWSMFNESFEKPLTADEQSHPGATTVMAAPPTQLLHLPQPDQEPAVPTLPRARLNGLGDPTQDLPPTAVHVQVDPETSPGLDVALEVEAAAGAEPLVDGAPPLVTPTPWDDVKVTSSGGMEDGEKTQPPIPRAEMPTELLAKPADEDLAGPPPTVALDILAKDEDVLTGPPPTVALDGVPLADDEPAPTRELRIPNLAVPPPATVIAGDPEEEVSGFVSVPGSIEIVMDEGDSSADGVIVDDTGLHAVDVAALNLDALADESTGSLEIAVPPPSETGVSMDVPQPHEDAMPSVDLLVDAPDPGGLAGGDQPPDSNITGPSLELAVPSSDVTGAGPGDGVDPNFGIPLPKDLLEQMNAPAATPPPSRPVAPPPQAGTRPPRSAGARATEDTRYSILTPGQPTATATAVELLNLLANPATGRTFRVAVGDALTRTAAELGTLLVLDNLALFPGLGDPPRHQGSTHTGRMVNLLKAYEQQHATGAFSLLGAQGQYAAFFLVDGRLHYVCMAGPHPPLLDGVVDRGKVQEIGLLLRMVIVENEPFYSAVTRAGLAQEDALAEALKALLFKRASELTYWGSCRFEYRPDVRLPYMLPVLDIPASSVTVEAP